MDITASKCQVSSKGQGGSYSGVSTRGLLDDGAKVTLVWKELMPMIREKLGWFKEQCQCHNLPLDVQPIGASGRP